MSTAFPLLRLPNELLYKVSGHLDTQDLCRVSLVSKRLRTIAQKTLHRSPDLTEGQRDGRLGHFAKTLSLRPDLAKVVRHLNLVAKREAVKIDVDVLAGFRLGLVELVVDRSIAFDEQQLAGLLLTSLLQLRELKIKLIAGYSWLFYDDDDMLPKFSTDPLGGLLGRDTADFDLTRIAGLRNLEKLDTRKAA
ncbi:hypothetical protein BDV96DRAFT_600920 [Lophiotrema nucula]|uniref:F-box domain-containing protein n=1 Tax=Lophiotrema nucula TaxID=690887 RepID=A0A6A5Z463_9PLEO|nr:hypothetical protein BDV96DRAFT_600920 [Lophiotrema nucula]